jgi:hypothetical protein
MVTVLEERRSPARSTQPNKEIRLKRVLVVVDGSEPLARVLERRLPRADRRGSSLHEAAGETRRDP